jgi:hypothetical protein
MGKRFFYVGALMHFGVTPPFAWQSKVSLSTTSVGDVSTFQPKVQEIVESWEPNIGLAITKDEVHEVQQLLQDHIGCFVFNLKDLGQLKG